MAVKVILFASDFVHYQLPECEWKPTENRRRSLFWAISDDVPAGFMWDDHSNWTVNGEDSNAYYSPDMRKATLTEDQESGVLSQEPKVAWTVTREFTIYEKLERLGPRAPEYSPVTRESYQAAAPVYDAYNKAVAAAQLEYETAINTAVRRFASRAGVGAYGVQAARDRDMQAALDTRIRTHGAAITRFRQEMAAIEAQFNLRPTSTPMLQPGQRMNLACPDPDWKK